MKNGAYIYKNEACEKKMHAFYDKSLTLLQVPYTEEYFETSFGRTHCLLVGDEKKPRICTIHGGNGITTLNLKLFLPLLSEYSILTPDVIGMPGKSEPHRNISSRKDEYGIWIKEVLDHYHIEKISFALFIQRVHTFIVGWLPSGDDWSLAFTGSVGNCTWALSSYVGKNDLPIYEVLFRSV